MEINTATFIMSNSDPKKCPKPTLPEYAFIGRSNVGKSSLINMLCNHKGLAKTSSTPGKTQLINHFLINENWFLADLPGYGYAKVSKVDRAKWGKMINNYIFNRENLMNTFVLVDVRHKPQEIDIEFMLSLGEKGIPFAIIFTKADKIKQQEVAKNLKNYKTHLLKYWEVLPPIFVTSSEKKRGAKEVLEYVESCNALFK